MSRRTRAARVHLDRDGRVACGRGDFERTSDESAVTCNMCLNLIYGVHGLGNRKADPEPCGTRAAYRRHLRHGEPACRSCLQAERRREKSRKHLRRAA